MTKYQEYFKKMVDENKVAFADFQRLHDEYSLNQDTMQEEFNTKGKAILNIIREYENRLCKNSEKTYSMFTGKLAEKFWEVIRKHYPMIDYIGIISKPKPAFSLRKINLNN